MFSLFLSLVTCLSVVWAQYYPVLQPLPQDIYMPPNNNIGWGSHLNGPNQHNINPGAVGGNGWVPPGGQQQCKEPRNGYQGVKRHDLFVGCVTKFDRLLYVDRFSKYGRWWSSREKIVDYPSFGRGIRRNETINGIWAFDKSSDGSGGVSIIRGGVGHKNVTVKFFSEESGRGFHYLLQIYGH